ncbi:MAG: MoxR family ATPase [Myxococcales bacterium]|nr:MoxR family ATPase [Myxococcales bacterium]
MPNLTQTFSGTADYIASQELMEAVNVALALERPLLIKGEPGTGKTLLARAVAEQLGRPLLTWHVKSTSRAVDGLYVYDAVSRLQDSRFGDKNVQDIRQYIRFGALGRSFLAETPSVVLIDEIDKADLEFPNDLLHELDQMAFEVVETGDSHRAKVRPLVIITSNNEKELPDAFLRRCIFHFIAFPDAALMARIVKVHHPKVRQVLLDEAMARFYWLRNLPELRKRPSTSELIDWLGALIRGGLDESELSARIPFLGTLLKKEQDLDSVQKRGRGWTKH